MNCKCRNWTPRYGTAVPGGSDLESQDSLILGTERTVPENIMEKNEKG